MDCAKTGKLIRSLRIEQGLTQKQLAEKINLSDKTISKWERGLGCPDISVLSELSEILNVNISEILSGILTENKNVPGNMKKINYYVCKNCGNIIVSTGRSSVSCCGRRVPPLNPNRAAKSEELYLRQLEDEWYIESDRPAEKDNFISFVAFASGDRIYIFKQYPQWEIQVRIPIRQHGVLFWYSDAEGLLYQNI